MIKSPSFSRSSSSKTTTNLPAATSTSASAMLSNPAGGVPMLWPLPHGSACSIFRAPCTTRCPPLGCLGARPYMLEPEHRLEAACAAVRHRHAGCHLPKAPSRQPQEQASSEPSFRTGPFPTSFSTQGLAIRPRCTHATQHLSRASRTFQLIQAALGAGPGVREGPLAPLAASLTETPPPAHRHHRPSRRTSSHPAAARLARPPNRELAAAASRTGGMSAAPGPTQQGVRAPARPGGRHQPLRWGSGGGRGAGGTGAGGTAWAALRPAPRPEPGGPREGWPQ